MVVLAVWIGVRSISAARREVYWNTAAREALSRREPLPNFLARVQKMGKGLSNEPDANGWIEVNDDHFDDDVLLFGGCTILIRVDSHGRIVEAHVRRVYDAL